MTGYTKHELKSCPRCGSAFECKPGNITQCQCYEVKLATEESRYIQQKYSECLCKTCLAELKEEFSTREK